MPRKIYKYGIAFIDKGRLLLCRPYAFPDLILPGGTKEGEETATNNLLREVTEELGPKAVLDVRSMSLLGNYIDTAAGRHDTLVEIELYSATINGQLKPSSEIKELVWFSKDDDLSQLSAIIRNKILPALVIRGLM